MVLNLFAINLSFRFMRCPKTHFKAYILSILAVVSLPLSNMQGQVNLKAGYNLSFMSDPGLNQVISTFNVSQDYTRTFNKVGWLQGFEGGVRFKADIHAFELTYQSAYQALNAEGQILPGPETYTDKINVAVNSLALGYQLSGDFVGGGVDIQYQRYKSRVRLLDEDQYKDIQEMWGMKFYLMLTLEGSGYVDAAIQPYYVLPFDAYDINPISQYLNQEDGPAGKKWTRVGITFVFYNGGK